MPSPSVFVSANGLNLHVVQRGEASLAIVFLHYWGGSGRTWDPVIERLAARYRCVAPDLRGWGRSGRTATDFRLATQASDVEAIIAALGLADFVLVGHSMGGKIAQLVAAKRPPGLRALVLVAPAPPTPVLIADEEKRMRLAGYRSEEGVDMVLGILAKRSLSDVHRQQVVADTLGGQEEAKEAWVGSNMAVDVSAAAAAIAVPVHVIVGDADRVEPEEVLRRELPPLIPGVRFHILAGVGHLAPLEAPEEISAIIADTISVASSTAAKDRHAVSELFEDGQRAGPVAR